MRSASPVALRLPGLRVCAVCFPGGAVHPGLRVCAVCFPGGAMLPGATGMWGLFPRWRCAYRGYGFV
ncbi:hypothetical protein, partial [Raoultella ornithinolytica]|uniref:hypothetical protein n=1 Tax=Raoultella ornithinolytica TaxID=54291 RepID=UPI002DE914F7|nr:hypothetical protein [Raoultella ornithinolytica]